MLLETLLPLATSDGVLVFADLATYASTRARLLACQFDWVPMDWETEIDRH